ncbi:MCE family protein [Nocardia sp. NPDC019395]|uniref:MCE family protein n=1 Tax=Nocardia sp. NPDC019395 TaxID=3154686 RepID=UPI0033C92B69
MRKIWSAVQYKLAALAMVTVLVLVVVVSLTSFLGGFTPEKHVAVVVPRSGLVMDPDAKVKFRGAEVGRVGSVEPENGQVRIELDMNPNLMGLVPGNALVDIRSTTVFGAKYVNFVAPPEPWGRLEPGQVLRGESVTVEFNTLFERLTEVLNMVEPAKLNATLTALGTALQGRGAQLGDLLVNADKLLREINPTMPALRHDFQSAAAVTNLYADTAPDLLRTVDNATALSGTLTDNEQNFDNLLLETIGLADTTGSVLAENEQNLGTALDLLRPTSELLNNYKPALTCVIRGIAKAMPLAEDLFGGRNPGASFNASFMYGAEAYQYPNDLPKVNATGGPRCDGVVDRVPDSHADYVVTDTSEVNPFIPSTRIYQNHPTVFEVLFGGMPGMR